MRMFCSRCPTAFFQLSCVWGRKSLIRLRIENTRVGPTADGQLEASLLLEQHRKGLEAPEHSDKTDLLL